MIQSSLCLRCAKFVLNILKKVKNFFSLPCSFFICVNCVRVRDITHDIWQLGTVAV